MVQIDGVEVDWLGHDGFRLKSGKTVYIDPFQVKAKNLEKGDYVLVSHEHFDHLSPDDLKKVVGNNTVIIASEQCREGVSSFGARETKIVKPGDMLNLEKDLTVEVVPAYNVNKFRAPGQPFHPKQDKKNGYILTIRGKRLYHTGDSDIIPEMSTLKADVAFLPVSGTYVMTAEEAAEAAEKIKPKVAIPMHYGVIVGSVADAERFKRLAKCDVKILQRLE
jgi:L-ascorbate metabolism protein UlaG (beta-lactamase superfamily)